MDMVGEMMKIIIALRRKQTVPAQQWIYWNTCVMFWLK